MRALVAEDDFNSRTIIEMFIQPHGEVVGAADGEEALRLYQEAQQLGQPFDLLLLDLNMPGKGGLEVLEEIRSAEQNRGVSKSDAVKVIILTGQADINRINEAQLLGITDFLLKPVDGDKLIYELQHHGLIEDPNDAWPD